jgi:GH15 family glucan-1,4-alpha-glucosidase
MTSSAATETRSPLGRGHLQALLRASVAVIQENQAASGAYVASPSFPVYRYCWFRDGSFTADAMSRAGELASAEAFFAWGARVLCARAERIEGLIARRRAGERIHPDEFLHCRYTLDGDEARDSWWNFQLDGYGTWLWALEAHRARHGLSLAPYGDGAALVIRYLCEFWAEPSYDWWEENLGHRHTATLAAIYGGLRAASGWQELPSALRERAERTASEISARVSEQAVREGRLVKWLGGSALDASLLACATPFRLVQPGDARMRETVRALEATLAHGGVHRYAGDTYYGGGEWLLLAALLGWHYAELGRLDDAWAQLEWVARHAGSSGDLPEQVDDHLLAAEERGRWLARWGPVASPLLWSHAMFVTLALELGIDGVTEAER